MTCDDAFDLLTLPAESVNQRDRARLDAHLARCASCDRLAEALSPALALFADADEEYAASATAWSDEDAASEWRLPEPSAGGLPRSSLQESVDRDPTWHAMRLAAAVLIGLTAGGLFYGRSAEGPTQARSAEAFAGNRGALSIVPSRQLGTAKLASFSLTEACLPHGEPASHRPDKVLHARPALDMLAQSQSQDLACCTDCHTAGGAAAHHRDAIAQVARSCQSCHTN